MPCCEHVCHTRYVAVKAQWHTTVNGRSQNDCVGVWMSVLSSQDRSVIAIKRIAARVARFFLTKNRLQYAKNSKFVSPTVFEGGGKSHSRRSPKCAPSHSRQQLRKSQIGDISRNAAGVEYRYQRLQCKAKVAATERPSSVELEQAGCGSWTSLDVHGCGYMLRRWLLLMGDWCWRQFIVEPTNIAFTSTPSTATTARPMHWSAASTWRWLATKRETWATTRRAQVRGLKPSTK